MSIHSNLATTDIKAKPDKEKLAKLSKSKLDSIDYLSQIKCRKIYKNRNKKADKDSKTLRAPIGWVGGKSKLAKDIVALFPTHKKYVEVFGGALNVFYKKPKDDKGLEIVNDINSDLINLHICIKEYPYTLSLYLRQMFISRELFVKIRRGELTSSNHIQKAAYFFYLITQSFGSKGTVFGMSAKSGRKPKDIYRDFNVWSKRLKGVTIENLSYKELIKRYDSEDTLFYLDPPYYSQESYYGKGDFDREDHLKLREILKNIKGKFLLSYNNHEEIKKLYSDDKFKIIESKPIEYILGKSVSKKKKIVSELFIMNY